MQQLLPLFLDLTGRSVLLVGGGSVAAAKLDQLLAAQADVRVVAPDVCKHIEEAGVRVERRPFHPTDLDDVWLVVAAATPDVNRQVAAAAERRRIFVNAVDDPANASAYLSGVVRRDGVTLAISTSGAAPALTGLLREGLDQVLPQDLRAWLEEARQQRVIWRRDHVPMEERRPRLLEALNHLYDRSPNGAAPQRDSRGGRTIERPPRSRFVGRRRPRRSGPLDPACRRPAATSRSRVVRRPDRSAHPEARPPRPAVLRWQAGRSSRP